MKAFFDVTDPVRGVSCSLSEAKKRELTIVTDPVRGVSCSYKFPAKGAATMGLQTP